MIREHQAAPQETPKANPSEPISLARIMVATDFSPTSDRALEYALSLARRHGSRVYLAHVITVDPMTAPELMDSSEEKQRLRAKTAFEDIAASGRVLGVPVEVLTENGSIWPTLEALVEKYEIELLIVGTHGVGAVQKVLIGSTAEQIFRKARVPVLTVGPRADEEPFYEMELKSILFATDFGPGVDREAAYAFFLAQEHRSRLTLLHVTHGRNPVGEREMEAIKEEMQELIPAGDLHCLPTFRVANGHPVEEILKASQEVRANLVIIGAKQRKGLAGHVPASTAYKIVCGARCPVLTIRS
ncbi:MAG: universal stress protein [Candidatus Acidiferrum sp.]|jgi:nucleotide-binding universal stress UspA family protein